VAAHRRSECGVWGNDDPKWQTVIAPLLALGKPVFPVLGNHDWGRRALDACPFSRPEAEIAKSGQPGFERWIFPGANYILRTPVAEFILYDSTPIAEVFDDQIQRPLCALQAALPRTHMGQQVTEWRPSSRLFNDIASTGLPVQPCGIS
jgi:hypothetical protein